MRNPFRIRASQRSVNDEEFVKLFGSGAFEVMRENREPVGRLGFLAECPRWRQDDITSAADALDRWNSLVA